MSCGCSGGGLGLFGLRGARTGPGARLRGRGRGEGGLRIGRGKGVSHGER